MKAIFIGCSNRQFDGECNCSSKEAPKCRKMVNKVFDVVRRPFIDGEVVLCSFNGETFSVDMTTLRFLTPIEELALDIL